MRAKWSAPIRKYWKISEQMMVKYCDLAICDSVNIEKYIHECYDGKGIQGSSPKTTFIAYGADVFDKDWPELPFAHREHIGCTVDYVAGRNRYMGYLISLGIYSFKGVKVGLDCANNHRDDFFANGREVRNFFERAAVNQANRLAIAYGISGDDIAMLTLEDVEQA